MKPEDRKRLKHHIEMIVEHKEPTHSQTEKILRDAVEEQIKGKLELEDKNRKLRLELHALRFKESQENRFVWWIYSVYAKHVSSLLTELEQTTFPVTPFGMSNTVKCLKEYTEHIYDGTYLDVEIGTDVKKGIPDNKPAHNENANSLLRSAWMIANRNGEQTNWEAFKNSVYKELVEEHNTKNTNPDYFNHDKTSTDNNKRSNWKSMGPGFAAPAVNKRHLVKLINDWICIATYYLRDGGGYWKDDRGQELADGVVSLWKQLEE